MTLTDAVEQAAQAHGMAEMPREACGLVIINRGRQEYVPCRNLAVGTDQFMIDPEDYAAADQRGEIVCIVHSHPNLPATPSQPDRVACEASGLPWAIVSVPSGQWETLYPEGYIAPLVGREWAHGVLDCYSIVRDYYHREKGITLPDYERHDEWWLSGGNLYEENFAAAGFREISVNDLSAGDVILMKIGSPVANHAAVYLGDGLILHHLQNRLSTRDLYDGVFQKCTVRAIRHGSCFIAG